jgi:large subunit ribosomal protein L29
MPEMAKSPLSKASDVRAKTVDELAGLLLDLRKEQFNLRFQRATGQQEGVGRVRQVRREIARVKTIQGEQTRSAQLKPNQAKPNQAGPRGSASKP